MLGRVVLVGAGPGGPGLLTLAAVEALRNADIVLYDRLAGPAFRRFVRPRTALVDVGKRPGATDRTQEEISRRLVEEARKGRTVVRMKGGDPFVFGRGYEEVVACLDAGIQVEVVPGVSSALAAPELAGVPLTNRGFAPAFTVVSGHEDPLKARPAIDWAGLVELGGPLVVLMGVGTIAAHAEVLVDAGMDPATPVAAVEWATTERQRIVRSELAHAADVFAAAGLASPAVIVIGDNVALGDHTHGMTPAPAVFGAGSGGSQGALDGWRILLPRSRTGPSMLRSLLQAEGAVVDELTVARFDPVPADQAETFVASLWAGEIDLVAVASGAGAQGLVAALVRGGADVRALAGVPLLAASGAARAALEAHGLVPDVEDVPAGTGLAVVAGNHWVPARVEDELIEAGWDVARVDVALRHLDPRDEGHELIRRADAVVFASSGTAVAWGRNGLVAPPVVACIGPATAEAVRAARCIPNVVAAEPTPSGLVAALSEYAAGRPEMLISARETE